MSEDRTEYLRGYDIGLEIAKSELAAKDARIAELEAALLNAQERAAFFAQRSLDRGNLLTEARSWIAYEFEAAASDGCKDLLSRIDSALTDKAETE